MLQLFAVQILNDLLVFNKLRDEKNSVESTKVLLDPNGLGHAIAEEEKFSEVSE